jgi:hypothetical protein
MSSDGDHKYSTGRSRRLLRDRDGGRVALTDHAIERWRLRTPHECPVSIREAWRAGEFIKHPGIARSDGESEAPDDVRVCKYGMDWGVAFLVVEDPDPWDHTQDAARVVVTVADLQTFEHGPTRAYLHSHGPHLAGDASTDDASSDLEGDR